MDCPLCKSSKTGSFYQEKARVFLRCGKCKLVFVPENHLPEPEKERERYLLHNNTIDNQGYVDFLYTFLEPLKQRVKKTDFGLDFGSGPNPVMAGLLTNEGFNIQIYDLFFANNQELLTRTYDYICCVETAEHFHAPRREWDLFHKIIKSGGIIGIKTEFYSEDIDFSKWHYQRDFTHVCFYSAETMKWIASKYNYTVEIVDSSVAFFASNR